MTQFFSHSINRIHFLISFLLSVINILIIIFLNPLNKAQGLFGNIFYIHVPIAWTAFLIYFFVMVSGILFLIKKDFIWDYTGHACAEVGTLFMFLVLVTGPLWAKPAWGYYWPWEPRLTTSLVLFVIYLGYFMLREFGGAPEQVSRYAAVLGIVAFLDVPIIFISVKFWLPEMQSHPQVGEYFEGKSSLPTLLIIYSLLSFILLSILMVRFRINTLKLSDNKYR